MQSYKEILALNHAGLYEPLELTAMSNVYYSKKDKITIQINPDRNRRGLPYFKVYNHYSYTIACKVARISMYSPAYIQHRSSDNKQNWYLNAKEKQTLVSCLQLKPMLSSYTIWQKLIIAFNNEKFGIPEEDTISITKENISEYKKSLENEGYINLIDLLSFDLQMPDYLLL